MGFRQWEGVVPKLKIGKGEGREGILLFIQESKGRCLCWLPSREGNLEHQGKVWENNL